MTPSVEVLPDARAAASRAASLIAEAARSAIAEREAFSLGLSGGSGPVRMFELIGGEVFTAGTDIFQVDERVAPDGDPDRNLGTQLRALPVGARSNVHPMPVTEDDLDAAATAYEEELPERLDLVHLGLGEDGHTASLVPGDPVLEVTDRRVALTGGEYHGRRRMTLTYPALASARQVFWLVTGEGKRDALRRLLDGDPSIPAGRVDAPDAIVIADEAAAGGANGPASAPSA
jgi:6-phosphogluconolactonase